MAYTVSSIVNTVLGDKRLWIGYVTPDSATQAVQIPGAVVVDAILSISPRSMATENTGPGYAAAVPNYTPLGTAAAGYIGFSGCTSTKVLNVAVLYH